MDTCGGISRNELANTVSELLKWKRLNGRLNNRECLKLGAQLQTKGILDLPDKRQKGNIAPCKRMKTVSAVYTIDLFERCPQDLIDIGAGTTSKEKLPWLEQKRVWACHEKEPD